MCSWISGWIAFSRFSSSLSSVKPSKCSGELDSSWNGGSKGLNLSVTMVQIIQAKGALFFSWAQIC